MTLRITTLSMMEKKFRDSVTHFYSYAESRPDDCRLDNSHGAYSTTSKEPLWHFILTNEKVSSVNKQFKKLERFPSCNKTVNTYKTRQLSGTGAAIFNMILPSNFCIATN